MSGPRKSDGSSNLTADYEIVLRDPQPVLRKKLGNELLVFEFESESFMKTGDNYGSTILKVRAIVRRSQDAEKEELQLVAKMLPPTDLQRAIFDSAFTFKKEIFFYEDLIPMYQSLYLGDLDVVSKCYGTALSSKDDAEEVGEDAVILLEDLKVKGYYMVDRHKGLDRDHIKVAITTLAKFHAIGLSIKYNKPLQLPIIQSYAKPVSVDDEERRIYFNHIIEELSSNPLTSNYVDRIKATRRNSNNLAESYYQSLEPTDPWACVVHADFWVNNALFHKNEITGKVDDCKLVDFQTYYLSSPLIDLLFFLCTSMESHLEWFDEMLDFYRNTSLEILGELGCATELFERNSFDKRLKIDAATDLFHILAMVKIVEIRPGEDVATSPINEFAFKRMIRIIQVFVQKEWI